MNALLSLGNVRGEWTGGFWKDRWDVCRENMVPHMWDLFRDPQIGQCWKNFQIAVGDAEGEHEGPPFWDGDLYKWLEGAIRVYGDSNDEAWTKQIEKIVSTIAQVQRDDGYIFTYDAIQRRNGGGYDALGNDLNFEVYNMGHLMSAGAMYHQMTGKMDLLVLGERAADYLAAQFGDLKDATPRTAICPSHYMGLAELHKITGKDEYLDLLKNLMEMRDMVPNGTDDNQDRIPLKEHREIVGHGVRSTYLYAGLTDLYMGQGDEDYRTVLEAVWEDMTTKKLYITGGTGQLYDGVSPFGVGDTSKTQPTHQSFGRAYEFPNMLGYNETCAQVGNYLWNFRMAQAFGEGKYGDLMERTMYNSILSGIDLDGDSYFYTNALRCVHDHPYELKWSRHREEFISSFCCPPNVVRTVAGSPDKIGVMRNGGPAFLLYGDSRATFERPDGKTITCNVTSDYPWDGDIEIVLESFDVEGAFPVYLRIPAWALSHSVTINGKAADAAIGNDGYVRLEQDWAPGDRIGLSLPMDVAVLESHPLVEENRNHVAIERGPIVYCIETSDLPEGVNVGDVYIDPDAQFTFEKGEIAGTELGVIKGELWARKTQEWSSKELYRRRDQPTYTKFSATLVPYFAWDNRGEGEMTVWIPVLPGK